MGSIIVATVLQTEEIPQNTTYNYSRYCGSNNCPNDNLPISTSQPSETSVYILLGLLLFLCFLGIITSTIFVENIDIKRYNKEEESDQLKIKSNSSGIGILSPNLNS